MIDQPPPGPGAEGVYPVAAENMADAYQVQYLKGMEDYGTPLRTWNGRDAYVDLMQELADASVYATQAMMERRDLEDDTERLRLALEGLLDLATPLCDRTCGRCAICAAVSYGKRVLKESNDRHGPKAPAYQRDGGDAVAREAVVARPKRVTPTPVRRWSSGPPSRPTGDSVVGAVLSARSERLPADRPEDGRVDVPVRPTDVPGGDGGAAVARPEQGVGA